MSAELISIKKIKPNPKNPRFIKDYKYKELLESLRTSFWMMEARPIVVDKNMVVLGGNQRLRACQELKYKEAWVEDGSKWTKEQQAEFIIKDNTHYGDWDYDMLANEWDQKNLQAWGVTGFPFEEDVLEAEEDNYEEPENIKIDVVLGDLIEIGEHRLLCGDCTDSEQVAKLMNDKKAEIVFTDPPWNVSYGKNANPNYKKREILNDSMSTNDFKDFLYKSFSNMALFSVQGCMTYVVMSAQEWGNTMLALTDNNYHWSSTIIWKKDRLILSRKDYHTQYEPIWYGWLADSPRLCKLEDRKQSDLWEIDKPHRSDLHPTTKPIELVSRALKNSSKKNNIVLDMFLGSGSTMVASHQLKRKCYAMELDPKYCQVIIDRMIKLDKTLDIKINGKKYEQIQ